LPGGCYLRKVNIFNILKKSASIVNNGIIKRNRLKQQQQVNAIFVNSSGSKDQLLFRKFSDSEIIKGILRQDDKILNWLYENYLESVRHHVLRNSGSEDDVSDVFQEAIITLYRQISENKLTLTSDLKGYFFGVARNIWSAQLRIKSRTTNLETDLPDDPDDNHMPVLEKIVSRAFLKLSEDAQTILRLFSDGIPFSEIASIMDLKNETYARRKKYLSKEALIELVKEDPEYRDYFGR